MRDKKDIYQLFLMAAVLIVLGMVFWIYADANIFHYTAHMDADVASETLLAEVMAQNGNSQPDTWYISTGRRIFAPPKLASYLYHLTGDNLNLSMGIACTVMVAGLIAAMLFFARQIGFSLLESLVIIVLTFVLSAPNNETQRMLFLYACYYTGHFICMFVVLGLYARAIKSGKLSLPAVIITLPLAVLNGVQGMHANMFFYMPLLGVEMLRRMVLFTGGKKKESLSVTVWVFVISMTALLSTLVMGTNMVETSRNIRHAPEKFFDIVLPSALEVLSFGRLPALIVVFVLLGITGYVYGVRHFKERPELWAILPVPIGVLVVVLSTTFTTAETAPRYFLMQVFVVGIGVGALMKLRKPDKTMWISLLVIVFGIHSAFVFNRELIKEDSSGESEYVRMGQWIAANGYDYGYSTFDHANTMTVMCNNCVKIRPVNSFSEMEGMKWLSDKNWYPPYVTADRPVCYVVSVARNDEFSEFAHREGISIIKEQEFDSFVVYVTERDYTEWVD